MFKKMICLITFVLPLVLFDSASAQVQWDAGGADNNFPLMGIYHGWGGTKILPSSSQTSRWLAQGYAVKKGQKALKSVTFVEVKDEKDKVIRKIRRTVNLFHRKQVEKM